ncbi:MAG: phytanoyl-CoA dioxygenase family protein [Gemmatimonadetes bacterium]|nr:phytanoyl-CoA dioxygenase family protein [Gemmatimonadota bacterium]MBT7862565.1 phytanoyl-CoA dioxygenase family protein [Gemmatimonadota bacterium]
MTGLSNAQVAQFKDEGFLIVEDAFDGAALETLQAELSERIDTYARQAQRDGLLQDRHETSGFHQRLSRLCDQLQDPAPLQKLVQGKLRTAGMFRILSSCDLLDIVESVIGPEILAHPQFNARAKLPYQDAAVVPWHQDLGYLEADAEETFMVNFWIPLVDATVENGCMEIITGSHRTPRIDHADGMGPAGNFKGLDEDQLPDGVRVMCPVRRGGVVLIQHKTIHRSVPNLSDHIRWSLDLRYSDPRQPTGRDDVPGFIARSKADPARVCPSVETWQAIVNEGVVPTGA